jgi:hypothetical protein
MTDSLFSGGEENNTGTAQGIALSKRDCGQSSIKREFGRRAVLKADPDASRITGASFLHCRIKCGNGRGQAVVGFATILFVEFLQFYKMASREMHVERAFRAHWIKVNFCCADAIEN